jgi:hypothetical protein
MTGDANGEYTTDLVNESNGDIFNSYECHSSLKHVPTRFPPCFRVSKIALLNGLKDFPLLNRMTL